MASKKPKIVTADGTSPAPEIPQVAEGAPDTEILDDTEPDTEEVDDTADEEIEEDTEPQEVETNAALKRKFMADKSLPKRDRLRAFQQELQKRGQRSLRQQRRAERDAEGFMPNRAEEEELYRVVQVVSLTPEQAQRVNAKGRGTDASSMGKARTFVVEVTPEMEEQISESIQVQSEG